MSWVEVDGVVLISTRIPLSISSKLTEVAPGGTVKAACKYGKEGNEKNEK